MLDGCAILLVAAGNVTKQRITILTNQIVKLQGQTSSIKSIEKSTHILVDSRYTEAALLRLLKIETLPIACHCLKIDWLTDSLRHKVKQSETQYYLDTNTINAGEKPKENISVSKGKRRAVSVSPPSSEDGSDALWPSSSRPRVEEEAKLSHFERSSFICALSSKAKKTLDVNISIIAVLEEMVAKYTSTSDKWRAVAYNKAINALRNHHKPIESLKDATALPGVGPRVADKIWEIASTGHLNKLDGLRQNEHLQLLAAFNAVWGAGPQTATSWIQAGFSSIEDLQTRGENSDLVTRQQRLGLRHYKDFLQRIPRTEVAEIETVVRKCVDTFGTGFTVETCGSYRRGRPSCGDVDILVSHSDGRSHRGLLTKIIDRLEAQEFLTAHLVTSTAEEGSVQSKYLGICRLPTDVSLYRRIDIIVCPSAELACARLYFTGSVYFTRSIRSLAKRLGMRLDNHALYSNVIRQAGDTVVSGPPLSTPTEESIFEHLGIPYRSPQERDH